MKPATASSTQAKSATAFAPATVANVAVGFDILGFALEGLGDHVTVERVDHPTYPAPIRVQKITGLVQDLPQRAELNTATVGLLKMQRDLGLEFGFNVSIEKGIPLGSGMGGSAASAVAAVVAANALLDHPLPQYDLLRYALEGESVASGAFHADNIAPCLLGGLQLVQSLDPIRVISLPVPTKVECILVHPKAILRTKEARQILSPQISLKDHVHQSALMAGFISGCYTNNIDLIRASLCDILIEPQRASMIQGFREAQKVALQAGALGCSISGSGPSIFAWVNSPEIGLRVQESMMKVMKELGVEAQSWVKKITLRGAVVTS